MSALPDLQISRPCPMKWSRLKGDARTRFCGKCSQNVYDLSQLTADEARTLIAQKEGLVCVRLFRRGDGTVITRDCRAGFSETFWAKFETFQRVSVAGFFAALFLSLGAAAVATLFGDNVRALLGSGTTGALAGDTTVTPRARAHPSKHHGHGGPFAPPGDY